jgi:serine/threonine protein kinase
MTDIQESKDNQEVAAWDNPELSGGQDLDLVSGSIFAGRYKILNLIGGGGMGSVYKALDLTLNRQVALKLLHRNLLPDKQTLVRFQQEARVIGRIKHPGVIAVYDFGLAEDQSPYLIMEYVQGISLANLIALEGQLEPERATAIFAKVSDTLAHTHSKGVIHRDLKPSNILIIGDASANESVRVIDFGIAKVLDKEDVKSNQIITPSGELFGSPLYMSPEQCRGLDADERSDVYSLGCVMYETISGHPPFHGATVYDTMLSQLNDPPPKLPMKQGSGQAGRDIERIITKALAKEPDGRYQSMAELRDDLNVVLAQFASSTSKEDNFFYIRFAAVVTGLVVTAAAALTVFWYCTSYSQESKAIPLHVWQSPLKDPVVPIPANYLEVETVLHGTLAAARHSEGSESVRAWQLTSQLADLHMNYGFYDEAARDLEGAIDIMRKKPADFGLPECSAAENLIGECYFHQKKYDKALIWYQKAAGNALRLISQSSPYFIQIYAKIGDIYYGQGNSSKALAYFQNAVKLSEQSDSIDTDTNPAADKARVRISSIDKLVLLMSLGDAFYGNHRYAEAADCYQRALSDWNKRISLDGGTTGPTGARSQILPILAKACCQYNLALTYEQLGDSASARFYFKGAWPDLIKYSPVGDPLLLEAISGYSEFLIKRDFPLGYMESFILKQQVRKAIK